MNIDKTRVGIIGGFQMGKSTLINCLLDGKVARTGGMGISVTSVPTRYTYGETPTVSYLHTGRVVNTLGLHKFMQEISPQATIDEVVITLWKPLLKYVDLIDTPGFDANDRDTETTQRAIKGIDFVIVLLNNKGLNSKETELFNSLYQSRKPFSVLVNCNGQDGGLWDPDAPQNRAIFAEIEGRIRNTGCKPIPINSQILWPCNLIWYWYATAHYLVDDREQAQMLEKRMNFFAKNILKIHPDDYAALVKKSNFLPVRAFFDQDENFDFPLNFMTWNGFISNSFIEWENNLKIMITKI